MSVMKAHYVNLHRQAKEDQADWVGEIARMAAEDKRNEQKRLAIQRRLHASIGQCLITAKKGATGK